MSRMITGKLFHANPFLPFSSSCSSLSRSESRDRDKLPRCEREWIRAVEKEEKDGGREWSWVRESLNRLSLCNRSFLAETLAIPIYCRFRDRNAVISFPVFFPDFYQFFFLWIFFLVIKNNLVSILLADFEIVISFPVFFGFLSIFFFMNIFLVIKNNLSVLLAVFRPISKRRYFFRIFFYWFFLLVNIGF